METRRAKYAFTTAFYLLIFLGTQLSAKSQGNLYKYQALFTIKFLKYTSWKQHPSNNSGSLTIGVVGSNTPVLSELLKLAQTTQLPNGNRIVIKRINDYAQLKACHIVFVPNNQNYRFYRVKDALKGSNTLIVTADEALIYDGADISFYTEGARLKFKLQQRQIERKSISVSSRLLSVATLIRS